MGQLQAHLERGSGKIPGQFWVLEVYEGGEEGELGLRGMYRAVLEVDTAPKVVFEPSNEALGLTPIVITEASLARSAVKVLSRKNIPQLRA